VEGRAIKSMHVLRSYCNKHLVEAKQRNEVAKDKTCREFKIFKQCEHEFYTYAYWKCGYLEPLQVVVSLEARRFLFCRIKQEIMENAGQNLEASSKETNVLE
jgi:hypothetical protein